MPIHKIINQLEYLDRLLKMRNTGSPEELAGKLGISKSSWFELKKELETEFSLKIEYCKYQKTYQYAEPLEFIFGYFRQPTADSRQPTADSRQR